MVQLGSIVSDVTWWAAALLGLAPLVSVTWVCLPAGAAGVIVLVWLGLSGLREALRPSPLDESTTKARRRQEDTKENNTRVFMPSCLDGSTSCPQTSHVLESNAFCSGIPISPANPMAIGDWISIGGVLLAGRATHVAGLEWRPT